MSYNVHIHVCFPCDSNEGVAEIASKHLIGCNDDCREARWFLDNLAKRTGDNHGSRGGLSLWGMIGNYTQVKSFCEALRPFWADLLGNIRGGPCTHEHVIVFEEREQTEHVDAYEIGWADDKGEWVSIGERASLVIKKHERLPFSWMQY